MAMAKAKTRAKEKAEAKTRAKEKAKAKAKAKAKTMAMAKTRAKEMAKANVQMPRSCHEFGLNRDVNCNHETREGNTQNSPFLPLNIELER